MHTFYKNKINQKFNFKKELNNYSEKSSTNQLCNNEFNEIESIMMSQGNTVNNYENVEDKLNEMQKQFNNNIHLNEDTVRDYFTNIWGFKIKSVKFVFDFKGALPELKKISEYSYKISKLSPQE